MGAPRELNHSVPGHGIEACVPVLHNLHEEPGVVAAEILETERWPEPLCDRTSIIGPRSLIILTATTLSLGLLNPSPWAQGRAESLLEDSVKMEENTPYNLPAPVINSEGVL